MTKSSTFPKPGDRIGGKYRIESVLGRGGMGAVFEASHEITNKHFAIKVLLPDLNDFDEVVKRFIREAQVAGRFQHPNVVEVYDIGQDDHLLFMVMELLQGESLATRLKREARLDAETACGILLPCLEGVAAAHAAGIIHRDLKPANIFLCPARGRALEHPKVLDFGISKLAAVPGVPDASKTDTGTVMGTPYYMAPEQLRAWRLDRRVDIYALGVTLYEMLSGKHPFEANNYPELVLKIASETPIPLERLVPALPEGLSAIVSRAMARHRDDRFPTVEAMAQAMERFATLPNSYRAPPQFVATRARSTPQIETTERNSTPLASESLVDVGVSRDRRQLIDLRSLSALTVLLLVLSGIGWWWKSGAFDPEPDDSRTNAATDAPSLPPTQPDAPTAPPTPASALPTPIPTAAPPPSAATPKRSTNDALGALPPTAAGATLPAPDQAEPASPAHHVRVRDLRKHDIAREVIRDAGTPSGKSANDFSEVTKPANSTRPSAAFDRSEF